MPVTKNKRQATVQVPRKGRKKHQNASAKFGLLAIGRSVPWEIAIDETTSGPNRWFAQIEGPGVSIYFEIPSVDIVGTILQFLEPSLEAANAPSSSNEAHGSLVICKDKKTPVTLVKDDEYGDRFFLLVGPVESPIVRLVIGGVDTEKIVDALQQVQEDLDDED